MTREQWLAKLSEQSLPTQSFCYLIAVRVDLAKQLVAQLGNIQYGRCH